MNTIKMSRKDMLTRDGILDEIMDKIFDVSILVDENLKIVNISEGSFPDPKVRKEFIGQGIEYLDKVSPFAKVIQTGKPATGLLLEIHDRKCISSVFPIEDNGKIIGAFGTIIFKSLRRVKRLFSQADTSIGDMIGQIYDDISRFEGGYNFDDFIGDDPTVRDLREKARKAARSNLPILIIGETGTGKEIISGAIHSARYPETTAPYVTINCTAIPDNLLESELFGHEKGAFTGADSRKIGKFEMAFGGDILLDEIGDMDLNMQSKLLRVLESKEFERVGGSKLIPLNAGIIASTNKNLFILSEEKQFRSDLYYRLNTIELFVPPLRRRPDDIPLLFDHFCDELDVNLRLSTQAMALLVGYIWPGNVRQLRNLTQRLSIFYEGKQISEEDISRELRVGQRNYNEAFGVVGDEASAALSIMDNSQRSAVIIAMKNNNNNISAAARELGISRGTMYNKLKKYGLC